MTRLFPALILLSVVPAFGYESGSLNPLLRQRHRLVVLTDIAANPDDTMSLIRLVTYSNVMDIENLAAVTSEFQENQIHPEMIGKFMNAYCEAQPNLTRHERGYPACIALKTKVTEACIRHERSREEQKTLPDRT